jgi:hypothetical protein
MYVERTRPESTAPARNVAESAGMAMRTTRTPPWKKPRPSTVKPSVRLTPAQKAAAKARAEAAGRHYPNLIDNMWAAKQSKDY